MEVGNGSKINGTCRIRTKIVLTCNSSAVWSNQDLTRKLSRAEKAGPCEVYNYSNHSLISLCMS